MQNDVNAHYFSIEQNPMHYERNLLHICRRSTRQKTQRSSKSTRQHTLCRPTGSFKQICFKITLIPVNLGSFANLCICRTTQINANCMCPMGLYDVFCHLSHFCCFLHYSTIMSQEGSGVSVPMYHQIITPNSKFFEAGASSSSASSHHNFFFHCFFSSLFAWVRNNLCSSSLHN